MRYLKENDLAWSYWALNGTQSNGEGRKYDTVETFGLLSPDYKQVGAPKIVELLRTIEKAIFLLFAGRPPFTSLSRAHSIPIPPALAP